MRTPAGRECPYFYGDYRRGRKQEECRLLQANPDGGEWRPTLCHSCPVPGIVLANACPHMGLRGRVARRWLGFIEQVEVSAYCHRSQSAVAEPEIGCGQCHEPVPALS
jgi:hypothetical protein